MPTTSAAAAGLGSPVNQRLSATESCVLKRARRNAAPAQYTNAAIQPIRPMSRSAHSYMTSAGAAPKDTMSARLSYSAPNADCVRVRRATRPSMLSRIIAMILDSIDGRVARLTRTQSAFGAEYDSLADMVSFGAAPALVMYEWALRD